jgi:hypothetical protein
VTTPPSPSPEAAAQVEEAPKKGKGGRPKGSKNKKSDEVVEKKPLVGQMSGELATYTPQDAVASVAVEESIDNTRDPTGFTLYLDCFPSYPYTDAAAFIAEAKQQIRDREWPDGKGGTVKVADYRYLPFGQGAGALAGLVLEAVKSEIPRHLVLSTRTPEGQIVVNDLIYAASFVVRGAA